MEITDRLLNSIADLASIYRTFRSRGDFAKAQQVVAAYHAVMLVLWDLPWDRQLEVMEELPDEQMPAFYLEYWKNKQKKLP
jgi:hypothetical protein